MRWIKTKDLRSTLSALFTVSTAPPPDPAREAELLEDLRDRMLELAPPAKGQRAEMLVRRIRYAVSVETLWYARGELMAQLARVHGEAAAREQVDALSGCFTELLPRGLRSRPSPLNTSYRSSRTGEG